MPLALPETLSLLVPDLDSLCSGPAPFDPERLLFFDLETTGLSGGAGTVAFLAACGRFASPCSGKFTELEITQFLLLDYPGEPEFLTAVLAALSSRVLVSYNGKSFDSQILKIRCLMNGMTPPLFPQLDLLHPSRRLWKRVLPNCSQALIETMILGLDRSGDIPGSLAPRIWFDFLRSDGDRAGQCREALLGICGHNVRDIFGLASLFRAFAAIAASPLEAHCLFRCDAEQLALIWRRNPRRASKRLTPRPETTAPGAEVAALNAETENREKTAVLLLEYAAQKHPYACLCLALDRRGSFRYEEGRARLLELRDWPALAGEDGRQGCTPRIRALALRALSIDAEKRLCLGDLALSYIDEALALEAFSAARENAAPALLPAWLRQDLERRKERILSKVEQGGWHGHTGLKLR
jgi:uncharacterized protein YprB with RNaseH-like and TPR domain